MAHDVFISYAIEDRRTAESVCEALEKSGITCWYAPRDVPFGVDYEEAIVDGIVDSRLVVLILSAHSNGSLHVRREIQNACAEEIAKPILPVRIDDVSLSKALRYYLSSAQWLDASTPPLEKHLQRLVQQLRSRLARLPIASSVTPNAVEPNPDTRIGTTMARVLQPTPDPVEPNPGTRIETTMARVLQPTPYAVEPNPGTRVKKTMAHHLDPITEPFDWSSYFNGQALKRTLLVVFGSLIFIYASFWTTLTDRTVPSSIATFIVIATAVFLLLEGIVIYIYMARVQSVRWWLFIAVLVVIMIAFVFNLYNMHFKVGASEQQAPFGDIRN